MNQYRNICVIIGCSNLGSAIASELSSRGENVLIIDKDATAFDKVRDNFAGNTITADATDITVLDENYVDDAKLIVIATNNENINIFLAHLISKLYNPKLVVVRLNTLDKKELVEDYENVKAIFPFSLSLKKFDEIYKESEE